MARPKRNQNRPKSLFVRQATPKAWKKFFVVSFAALVVAPHFIPCEAHSRTGVTTSVTMLWLVMLCAWFAHQSVVKDSRIRFGRVDGILLGLVLLNILSSVWTIHSGQSVNRPAINMATQWTGVGAMYFLGRQLLDDGRVNRALCALMLALGLAMSVHGVFQITYSFPRVIRTFESNPEGALRMAGFVVPEGSPQRSLFESRLLSCEPTSTYALTNSLAGYLATWSVMLAGLCLGPRWWQPASWQRYAFAILLGLPMIVCLWFTHSRTGQLACVIGVILVLIIRWQRAGTAANGVAEQPAYLGDGCLPTARTEMDLTPGKQQVGLMLSPYVWVTVMLVFTMIVAIGFLLLFPDSSAAKSLIYRWEYWQATASMIWDNLLWGCGPGQFQDVYAAYKLPQASEMIADPHNLFLEIWATSGTPAMLCLLAFIVEVMILAFIKNCGDQKSFSATVMMHPMLVWVGGVVGATIGYLVSWVVGYPVDVFFPMAGIPLAALAWSCTATWVDYGRLPVKLLAICLGTLCLNLCAAGGINYLSVNTSLLVIAIFLIHSCEKPSSSRLVRRPGVIVGLVISLALILFAYRWSYMPIIQGQSHVERGSTLFQEASRRTDHGVTKGALLERAVAEFKTAAAQDPHDPVALMQLARTQLEQQIRHRDSLSGQRFSETLKLALSQQPRRYVAWQEAATWYGEAFRRWGEEEQLSNAIQCWQKAAKCYPNGARLQAELAWWMHLAGVSGESRIHACRALKLNNLNPHAEYKLERIRLSDPGPLGAPNCNLDGESASLPGPAEETAITWMTRLCNVVQ